MSIKKHLLISGLIGFGVIGAAAVATTLGLYVHDASSSGSYGVISLRSYFHSGNGTASEPYVITRPRHLYNLSRLQGLGVFTDPERAHFQLGSPDLSGDYEFACFAGDSSDVVVPFLDMESSTHNHQPINAIGSESTPFFGEFDGKGLEIKNLNVYADPQDAGLFGYTAHGSHVHDLFLDDVRIHTLGYQKTEDYETLYGDSALTNVYFTCDSIRFDNNEYSDSIKSLNIDASSFFAAESEEAEAAAASLVNIPSATFTTDNSNDFKYKLLPSGSLVNVTANNAFEVDAAGVLSFFKSKRNDDNIPESAYPLQASTTVSLVASLTDDYGLDHSRVLMNLEFDFSLSEKTSNTIAMDVRIAKDHGNNIGLIVGHCDGGVENCYVSKGSFWMNDGGEDFTPMANSSHLGLIGLVGGTVFNQVSESSGAGTNSGKDVGVLDFTTLYSEIAPSNMAVFDNPPQSVEGGGVYYHPNQNTKYIKYLRYDGAGENLKYVTSGNDKISFVGQTIIKENELGIFTVATDFAYPGLGGSLSANLDYSCLRMDDPSVPARTINVDDTNTANFSVTYNAPTGKSVYAIGEFNDWTVSPQYKLNLGENNVWSKTLSIDEGYYRYQYAVADSSNPTEADLKALNKGVDDYYVYYATGEYNSEFHGNGANGHNTGLSFGDYSASITTDKPKALFTGQYLPTSRELATEGMDYREEHQNYFFRMKMRKESRKNTDLYFSDVDTNTDGGSFVAQYFNNKLVDTEGNRIPEKDPRCGLMIRNSLGSDLTSLSASFATADWSDTASTVIGCIKKDGEEVTKSPVGNAVNFEVKTDIANVTVIAAPVDSNKPAALGVYRIDDGDYQTDLQGNVFLSQSYDNPDYAFFMPKEERLAYFDYRVETINGKSVGKIGTYDNYGNFTEASKSTRATMPASFNYGIEHGFVENKTRLYAHTFKLPAGRYFLGSATGEQNDGLGVAKIYYVCAQGQTDGQISFDNNIFEEGAAVEDCDFIMQPRFSVTKNEQGQILSLTENIVAKRFNPDTGLYEWFPIKKGNVDENKYLWKKRCYVSLADYTPPSNFADVALETNTVPNISFGYNTNADVFLIETTSLSAMNRVAVINYRHTQTDLFGEDIQNIDVKLFGANKSTEDVLVYPSGN